MLYLKTIILFMIVSMIDECCLHSNMINLHVGDLLHLTKLGNFVSHRNIAFAKLYSIITGKSTFPSAYSPPLSATVGRGESMTEFQGDRGRIYFFLR